MAGNDKATETAHRLYGKTTSTGAPKPPSDLSPGRAYRVSKGLPPDFDRSEPGPPTTAGRWYDGEE